MFSKKLTHSIGFGHLQMHVTSFFEKLHEQIAQRIRPGFFGFGANNQRRKVRSQCQQSHVIQRHRRSTHGRMHTVNPTGKNIMKFNCKILQVILYLIRISGISGTTNKWNS